MQYCSLQHQTLLPSPVTSTMGYCFPFGSISSFFLELFLHSSLVAYSASTSLGSSSFSVITFCLFILFTGFSSQNTKLVCHSLLQWATVCQNSPPVTDFIFLGSQVTAHGDCSHEIKRHLFLGRKAMTNLDSILKSRDITFLTKVSMNVRFGP